MGSWDGGSTTAWRKVREEVLRRDAAQGWGCRAHEEGWCEAAGRDAPHQCRGTAPLTGPHPGHAHHTRGRRITGDDPRFIVSSCRECNLHIGDPSGRDREADPPGEARTHWALR